MKPRYSPRATVTGSAVFTVGGFTGEGEVRDLTVPGCSIDSPFSPKKGEVLTLRLHLPEVGVMFRVLLGVVRWVRGSRFGVEFLEMDHTERLRFNAIVGELLQQQAASQAQPGRKSYSRQSYIVNRDQDEREVWAD
jgi:hypothetical protein